MESKDYFYIFYLYWSILNLNKNDFTRLWTNKIWKLLAPASYSFLFRETAGAIIKKISLVAHI